MAVGELENLRLSQIKTALQIMHSLVHEQQKDGIYPAVPGLALDCPAVEDEP
jgi:hypothetical protein